MLSSGENGDKAYYYDMGHFADFTKYKVASLAKEWINIKENILKETSIDLTNARNNLISQQLFSQELKQIEENLIKHPRMSLNQVIEQLQTLKKLFNKLLSSLDIVIQPLDIVIQQLPPLKVSFSASSLNILNSSKEKARHMDIKYYTPFPLLAFLQSSNEVIEYLNQVRAGLAEELINKLSNYINNNLPKSKEKEKFQDFGWEELEFVQEAFIYAQKDRSPEILEKHLLLGILDGQSKTVKAMKDFFEKNNLSFDLLINNLKIISTESTKQLNTPDANEIFGESSDTFNNNVNLDTPDTDKIF